MKITKHQYNEAVHVINLYREQIKKELEEIEALTKSETKVIYTEDTYLYETDISMRLLRNIMHNQELIRPSFKDLKHIRESKVLRWRGVGRGTVNELKSLMLQAGMELKK